MNDVHDSLMWQKAFTQDQVFYLDFFCQGKFDQSKNLTWALVKQQGWLCCVVAVG